MKIETQLAITQHVATFMTVFTIYLIFFRPSPSPPPNECKACHSTIAIEPIPVHVEITMKEPVVAQAQTVVPTPTASVVPEADGWSHGWPEPTLPLPGPPGRLVFGGPEL